MSETPTPVAGPGKRRGLTLAPRGQALARLQDLEEDSSQETASARQDEERAPPEGINAVNTARSNAVITQGSTDATEAYGVARSPDATGGDAPAAPAKGAAIPAAVPTPRTVSPGSRALPAAVREPTTRITVDMPDSLHRKLSMLSAETRRSIKDLVIEALAVTYFETDADRP